MEAKSQNSEGLHAIERYKTLNDIILTSGSGESIKRRNNHKNTLRLTIVV